MLQVPRAACGIAVCLTFLIAIPSAVAQSTPLGGFIPFVGFGMTKEAKTIDDLDLGDIPFIAERETSVAASQLLRASGASSPYFDLALFDSGAATHIITQQAYAGFNIVGNGMRGENQQVIGGATGQLLLDINDAGGVYVAGLGDRTSAGSTLGMNVSKLRGQSSFATLTAPTEWELPNIIGLPMAAQHAVSIRNDLPQIFQHTFEGESRTVRTPQLDFMDLGTGNQQGITRRLPLKLHPGIGFVQGPQFVFNLDIDDIFSGGGELNLANNPSSPSVIIDSNSNGGGLFVDVNMANGARSFFEKEFFFDTGADLTVVSQQTAVRLGFDPVLDTPDFVLQVEGSGGVQDGIPGFYVDELSLDTIGGSFTAYNVPVAVLDVTNPNDPGNVVNGILGTHLFNDRNLVIDANASIGQGGNGPSLYISDPITQLHTWNAPGGTGAWSQTGSWNAPGTPGALWDVVIKNSGATAAQSNVVQNHTVYRVRVEGAAGGTSRLSLGPGGQQQGPVLTVYQEVAIGAGGSVEVAASATLDAAAINIEAGGVLSGGGTVKVGNGPISNAVRNLAGRIEPNGELTIHGDLANMADGVIAFDLGASDSIDVSRFAFLAGVLEVDFASGFTPNVNDSFTLITADEGVNGEFTSLDLPAGFDWDLTYNINSVVLTVEGLSTGLLGDLNGDGSVDAADYTTWRDGLGTLYTQQDYVDWRNNYGATSSLGGGSPSTLAPEPAGLTCALTVLLGILVRPARRSRTC